MKQRGFAKGVVASLLVATALFASVAFAQRLRATAYITQTAIPGNLSERALLAFARSHTARRMNETTSEPIAQRKWNGDLVINFASAPGDLEFHVLFYDITDGSRRFVDDMSTYLNDRNQRTYIQRLRLARPRFKPNHRYEAIITVRREEVGKVNFETFGEQERRDGVVNFEENENTEE